MDDRKWNVIRGGGRWRAFPPNWFGHFLPKFDTWQEAFDHAFKEATRELSDR